MPRRPAGRLPLLLTSLLCVPVSAAVLRVGPDEALQHIADAARLARDGDTVEIAPGRYPGDVAVWTQQRLTIRGLDDGPVLDAAGQSAEGKAIWVVRGGHILIDNITFRGARVPHLNGAGIRFEHGHLRVTNSRFIDNENGILTSNDPEARLHVENSVFAQAPRHPGALHHLLYVGRIAEFTLRGSRVEGGYQAHLVKSRARRHRIEYNLLVDGPTGEAAYELEFPEGGRARVVGNIIGQSANTSNPALISFGAEGYRNDDNRLSLCHNTLISAPRIGARFLSVWQHAATPSPEVMACNNLLVGPAAFAQGNPGEFVGNLSLPAIRPDGALDFRLPANSLLRGAVRAAMPWHGADLRPRHEFVLPYGTRPLSPPRRWAPGAIQSPRP
ncbi:hypothetical protein [Denitromonas iodatirespirans]|uniref:Right handed beta helix domain-containing protein n=1 Tax=Denitromonas iodatirespirans TaxID=2795389 RepID=A0A944DKU4_DENI1|nr:hypothetical protein [Denitromonas iodatirespirans]MBT0960574.1 hypothetical protein [Denitromonas iodatirespirans]